MCTTQITASVQIRTQPCRKSHRYSYFTFKIICPHKLTEIHTNTEIYTPVLKWKVKLKLNAIFNFIANDSPRTIAADI